MINLPKERKVIIVIGKTGSGKTFLVKKLIGTASRVIIIDKQWEYDGGVVVYSFSEFARYVASLPTEPKGQVSFFISCRFNMYYHVDKREYDKLFEACWELGNLTLVVEDIQTYINSREINSDFLPLLSDGRHKRINIIGLGQVPVQFPPLFRSTKDTMITFAIDDPLYLKQLEEAGFDPAEVLKLSKDKHDCLVIGEPLERIKLP